MRVAVVDDFGLGSAPGVWPSCCLAGSRCDLICCAATLLLRLQRTQPGVDRGMVVGYPHGSPPRSAPIDVFVVATARSGSMISRTVRSRSGPAVETQRAPPRREAGIATAFAATQMRWPGSAPISAIVCRDAWRCRARLAACVGRLGIHRSAVWSTPFKGSASSHSPSPGS